MPKYNDFELDLQNFNEESDNKLMNVVRSEICSESRRCSEYNCTRTH